MIEAVVSFVAEILFPLVLGVLEVATVILIASVRPWRYVMSPSFRTKTNAEMGGLSAWQKCWHFTWGSLAIAGSIAVVTAGVSVYTSSNHDGHHDTKREKIVQKAEEVVAKRGSRASEAAR